ncbi:MAG: DNA polymerase III subunit beta [Pseudomonadota bacterium]
MQVSIERSTLLMLLNHAQNVVERRTTIPILANIRLDAGEGRLGLVATDLELTLHEAAGADVLRAGALTLPAHTFFDVVRKLPEASTVQIAQDVERAEAKVTAGRSVFELPTLPASDFPSMTHDAFERSFRMTGAELVRLIDRTRFAMSTEEARYYLNGLHLHTLESGADAVLRAVATDGHRLAKAEMPLPAGAGGMPPIIVPRKAVGEIRKLVEGAEEVSVSLSTSKIQVRVGDAELVSRLIDGQFPDYERVIPKSNDKRAVVDAQAFAKAVDRVATIATEKTRAIKLHFDSGRMTLSAVSSEAGRGEDQLDVGYADSPLEIGFNARYVLEMLGQIAGDDIEMEIANPASPTLVRDTGDSGVVYVLMPMRV